MILIIQICFILLSSLVAWCEYSPFFANTVKSIIIRTILSTSMIGACYSVKHLENLSYEIQFFVMTAIIALTFLSVKFILNKYRTNKKVKQLRNKLKMDVFGDINNEQY